MLLGELIVNINSGKIKTKDISKEHDIALRTVQNRIKSAGFEFDRVSRQWKYQNELFEVVDFHADKKPFNLNVDEFFKKRDSKGEPQDNEKEQTSINVPKESKEPQKEPITKDLIDELLNAEPNQKRNRVFKGFYFDSDVLQVIDSVADGKKSDLINEILREVFTERGRL